MEEFPTRLKVRVIPYAVWMSDLETSGKHAAEDRAFDEETLRASPALQLLAYFQLADVISPGREQLGVRVLSTTKAGHWRCRPHYARRTCRVSAGLTSTNGCPIGTRAVFCREERQCEGVHEANIFIFEIFRRLA